MVCWDDSVTVYVCERTLVISENTKNKQPHNYRVQRRPVLLPSVTFFEPRVVQSSGADPDPGSSAFF